MSIAAVSAVLDCHVEDPSSWRVLVTLADYADPHGRHAFPSVSRLTDRTGYARSTIQRDLASLLGAGLIRRGDQQLVEHLPANRRPAVYDLDLVAIRGTRQGSDHRAPTGARQGPDRGPTGARSGTVQGPDSSGPNQELNLENQRARELEPAGPLVELDVATGRTVGRCAVCEQLVTPRLEAGRPVGTASHQHPAGGACTGADLAPTIVTQPAGDYRTGAARARTALHPATDERKPA